MRISETIQGVLKPSAKNMNYSSIECLFYEYFRPCLVGKFVDTRCKHITDQLMAACMGVLYFRPFFNKIRANYRYSNKDAFAFII